MPLFGLGYGNRGGHRGGFKMRLIIALVIGAIALFMYFSRTEVNPVTGEKQRIAMSVEQEKALGLQAAPQMAEQMGGVLDHKRDPMARFVVEVGNRIVTESDAKRSPYVGNYNFYLLADDESINAFALPGGQIFITRALLSKLDNEAQLAGVLGHEIGHVINRHAAEHMAKGQLGQMLATAVAVGASGDERGQMAGMAAMMVNQMMQLRFSRQDETESDDYGVRYMAQAGYDPTEMLHVMKVLAEASKGAHPPEMLATHPNPEKRHEDIKAMLAKAYPNGIPAQLTKGRALEGEPMLGGERQVPAKRDQW
ncbi:MAG: M48 family metalloprotease [Tepidisphaeraceae bacterium]